MNCLVHKSDQEMIWYKLQNSIIEIDVVLNNCTNAMQAGNEDKRADLASFILWFTCMYNVLSY